MTRFSATPFALILFAALTIQARAADPDVKLQEAPRPSSVQIVFANLPKANYSPTILPDLYLPNPRASAAATVIIPRPVADLNITAANRLSGNSTGFGAASSQPTPFDLGFSSFAGTSTTSAGQSAIAGSSLSDKLLVTPPSLRDAALGFGASQFVPSSRYLDDGHQFLNR